MIEVLNEVTAGLSAVAEEVNAVAAQLNEVCIAQLNEVTAEITKCPGRKYTARCFEALPFS